MIRDLYIRSIDDPNYRIDLLDHNDPIESIITKLKMILGTRQGQVLGDMNFGVGVEDIVFETRLNARELEERIKGQIYQYVTEAAQYKIEPLVRFGKDNGIDYCVIDFFIDNEKVSGVLVK